jgi:hypothetical protein
VTKSWRGSKKTKHANKTKKSKYEIQSATTNTPIKATISTTLANACPSSAHERCFRKVKKKKTKQKGKRKFASLTT